MGEKEMNETENYVKKQYEKQGYTVIRNGVPDFLLIKDGKLSFSEVKTTKDKLSKEQIHCHEVLKNITFEVKTDIVKDIKLTLTDIHSILVQTIGDMKGLRVQAEEKV